jgi:predicted ribosomally synthesized peptide with SipW-like signal peptide
MKKTKKIKSFLKKNGKIAKSVLVIAIVLAAAGTTYALFSDRATSEANAISAGDANLKIKIPATDCSSWSDICPGKQWSNAYPGFADSYEVFLKNVSASPITLKVVPLVEETGSNQTLYDNTYMEITWDSGSQTTGRYSLQAWKSNTTLALKNLAQNEEAGPYLVKIDIPESAGNEVASANITFDIVFDATQMQEYSLTVQATGIGEVTGTGNYLEGSLADISASTEFPYMFFNWTGTGITDPNSASTTVLMDAEKTVTANFIVAP